MNFQLRKKKTLINFFHKKKKKFYWLQNFFELELLFLKLLSLVYLHFNFEKLKIESLYFLSHLVYKYVYIYI